MKLLVEKQPNTMNTRKITLAITLALCVSTWAFAQETFQPVSPDDALAKLQAGNEWFATHHVIEQKPTMARREATINGQHPFAIVIGCADSRTAPEIIFDQNIGDLFVIRTAGNLVDDHALGSIEYAVEHCGTRLIVVLGHESCGAVTAALKGGAAPGHIKSLVDDITPAVTIAKSEQGDLLANAVHENSKRVAEVIRREAKLGEFASQVKIVTAYYSLTTGKVEWSKP